ncbi:MAG: Gx transporter family protein [Oscillospiraceae bacterium]|nr:Gx transporter family protein [Oscillospiraceae bacterium]
MKNKAALSEYIQYVALTAMFLAASVVLSIVENMLPPLPIPVPGVKLGLSNIPVMYTLFFLSKKRALVIATLKSCFVVITRGLIAGFLSFSGGVLSILIMAILLYIFKEHISYMVLSIFGAVFHNIGQFTAISLIFTNLYMWVYLPILLFFGIIAGFVTSVLLRFSLPALKYMKIKK